MQAAGCLVLHLCLPLACRQWASLTMRVAGLGSLMGRSSKGSRH